MPWTCFLIEPLDQAQRRLRRYTFSDMSVGGAPCLLDPYSYGHNASVAIDAGPFERGPEGLYRHGDWPHNDPRWPAACAYGYPFAADDPWQLSIEPLYQRVDMGRRYTLARLGKAPDAAPIGVMRYTDWAASFGLGPDGKALAVRLPSGHDWTIDAPSSSGGFWTRTGTPPTVS